MKEIRILVIGEEAVGKTSLIERYVKDTFLINHTPTVINEYEKFTKFHQLHIRDCSALPEFTNLRFMQYAEVDIILFCFNMAMLDTLDQLKCTWLPEVNKHCGDALRILVGCKNDLASIINEGIIIDMQNHLKINKFVKCSAKNNANIEAVFSTALNAYKVSKLLPLKRFPKKR